jgi:periplasmic divalent cation tolerance protein
MPDVVVAFTTFPAGHDVTRLAQELVASGLAACVQIVPGMTSIYTWKGAPQADGEQQVIFKTTANRVRDLWEALRAGHPYETPEFVVLPVVDGSEAYLKWVGESVR